ncbi:MAG: precorrin-2 C(20)-methyltransferase [Alphaproteobacteria bacterium]
MAGDDACDTVVFEAGVGLVKRQGEGGGRLVGIGVGPGDPELLTLKGLARLREADVVAFPVLGERAAFTRRIVADYLRPGQRELSLTVPLLRGDGVERLAVEAAYDDAAERLAEELAAGHYVALLCEGDPFFYGSFAYFYERLVGRWPVEVIPGVSSLMAAASRVGRALSMGSETFCVLSGTAPIEEIRKGLEAGGNFAIIKPNRRWTALLDVLGGLDLLPRSQLVIHAGLEDEEIHSLADSRPESVPYFSLILVRGL